MNPVFPPFETWTECWKEMGIAICPVYAFMFDVGLMVPEDDPNYKGNIGHNYHDTFISCIVALIAYYFMGSPRLINYVFIWAGCMAFIGFITACLRLSD